MHYTLLFYERPEDFAQRNDPEHQKEYWAAWPLYMKAIRESGVFVSGAGLEPPETATTVRLRRGEEPLVQDGPVADTKEQLGGFFIIDVPDLDTALAWAARCPVPPGHLVEVRPNMVPRN
ncbi:dgpfaetke family protein [Gordoniibacillus kamchatkensis]|uniref:Dgpfaetke family protein n=1 Tax=Gordoniibacillus kamchatkensis TaxID=1590651 RepID=A0ABR5AFZ8_9BACL|nr:YciI family protein [Paenibacillus sp. VKM B-2647]KIL39988.1 dgpfaetke family protein [Paenibacillus sp. VKM B-2647]